MKYRTLDRVIVGRGCVCLECKMIGGWPHEEWCSTNAAPQVPESATTGSVTPTPATPDGAAPMDNALAAPSAEYRLSKPEDGLSRTPECIKADHEMAQAIEAARVRAIIQCRQACMAVHADAEEAAKAKDIENNYKCGYMDAAIDCDEAMFELLSLKDRAFEEIFGTEAEHEQEMARAKAMDERMEAECVAGTRKRCSCGAPALFVNDRQVPRCAPCGYGDVAL